MSEDLLGPFAWESVGAFLRLPAGKEKFSPAELAERTRRFSDAITKYEGLRKREVALSELADALGKKDKLSEEALRRFIEGLHLRGLVTKRGHGKRGTPIRSNPTDGSAKGSSDYAIRRTTVSLRLELARELLGPQPKGYDRISGARNPLALAHQAAELAFVGALDGGIPDGLWKPPGRIFPHPLLRLRRWPSNLTDHTINVQNDGDFRIETAWKAFWSARDRVPPEDDKLLQARLHEVYSREVYERRAKQRNDCWTVKAFDVDKSTWVVEPSDYRLFLGLQQFHQNMARRVAESQPGLAYRALGEAIAAAGAPTFSADLQQDLTTGVRREYESVNTKNRFDVSTLDMRLEELGSLDDAANGEFGNRAQCKAGLITVVCSPKDEEGTVYFLASWRSSDLDEYPDSFGVVPAGTVEYAFNPIKWSPNKRLYQTWGWVEQSMLGVFLKEFWEEVDGGPDAKWDTEDPVSRFADAVYKVWDKKTDRAGILESTGFQMTGAAIDLPRRSLELSAIARVGDNPWKHIVRFYKTLPNYESAAVIPLPLRGETLRLLENRFVIPPSISVALWRALQAIDPADSVLAAARDEGQDGFGSWLNSSTMA